MPTSQPNPADETPGPDLPQLGEGGPAEGLLPRFRLPSPPRPPRPAPADPAETADPLPLQPSDPTLEARSSQASTDGPGPPPGPSKPAEEVVDPKDLQQAVTQVADIAFVLLGQGLGRADQKARQLPAIDDKWTPTEAERRFVSEPAARIAKRHLKTPREAMDVIDGCLIAVGVGAFAVRGVTGTEPLTPTKET